MIAEAFLDTNVLVYAVDSSETSKQNQALELIQETDFGLSAQVLQEFYVTVTRRIEVTLEPAVALEWIESLEVFPCQEIDSSLIKGAAVISERYQVSYWDGAIIAAAEALGAGTLFSEDLNDGQEYGGVIVRNPFLN